jgi:hypothetical protein
MLPLFARKAAICFCWSLFLAIPAAAFAQTNYYGAEGTEYAIVGSLLGDQVYPDAALNANGGFVVWQDNATDGSGWGVSAARLDGTLSESGGSFRVNVTGTNDQEHARVALLNNGGAVFVWQGGLEGVNQHIYARFLNASNTWLTGDVSVSAPATNIFYSYTTNVTTIITTNQHTHPITYTTNTITTVVTTTNIVPASLQINPAVAVLTNGNIIVVWSSFNQAGATSMQDVYGQMLSSNGTAIGTNFLINQFTAYNQRNPAVAALNNGGFIVAWVSEQERVVGVTNSADSSASSLVRPSVDIYGRLYAVSGNNVVPSTGEFLINNDFNPCSSPAIATASDGSYMVTWCAMDMSNSNNGWDIYARSFTGASGGAVIRVNTYLYGDQYVPRISAIGGDYLIVWTSLGQDGSREGVYGQFVHEDGSLVNNEFRVNTTTVSEQMHPVVASDGAEQFLVVWTSFVGSPYNFDLYAQRYVNGAAVLLPMAAPFVWAPFVLDSSNVYQPQLIVSWPPLQGLPVADYEVYVDGGSSPMAVTTNNVWTMTATNGLTADSTHSFALDYVTTDGRRSPISPSATGTTWEDCDYYGIPCQWMEEYYGNNIANWPAATTPVASGGPTLLQIFMSGGNPTNSATWLQQTLTKTSQGMYLSWNTQPGLTYQVQTTTDFSSWSNLGAPRFAAGTSDSIFVGNGTAGYYRVQLLRQ